MEMFAVVKDFKNSNYLKSTNASDALRRKLSNTCWQNDPTHKMSERYWESTQMTLRLY